MLAIQRPRLCRGLREPLHVTLSGGTLQLLRSSTLSPNSAPLHWQCQKAPAPIEKAQCMAARVTPRAEDARRGEASWLAHRSGSVTRALTKTLCAPAPAWRRQRQHQQQQLCTQPPAFRPPASVPTAAFPPVCASGRCPAPLNWASTCQTAGSLGPRKRYWPIRPPSSVIRPPSP